MPATIVSDSARFTSPSAVFTDAAAVPAASRSVALDAYRGLIMILLVSHGFGFSALKGHPVWGAIAAKHPGWGLSEIEFKAMLAEAHRTGHIVLATADLKDKRLLRELQESAIAYKNTVFHLVRVED